VLLLQLLLVLLASETNKNAGIWSGTLGWDGGTFISVPITSKERLLCEFVHVCPLYLISLNLTLILGHNISIDPSENLALVGGECFGVANIFSSFILRNNAK
jgi:hypothetical protein